MLSSNRDDLSSYRKLLYFTKDDSSKNLSRKSESSSQGKDGKLLMGIEEEK